VQLMHHGRDDFPRERLRQVGSQARGPYGDRQPAGCSSRG
jgi:hypothetical protein